MRQARASILFGLAVLGSCPAAAAHAETFEFAAPPGTKTNMVYRVNPTTGEMGACTFGPNDTIGTTLCYKAGEGAGAQPQGDYHLIASHYAEESGLFRVNQATGTMSVCYVKVDTLVCTPPR